MALARIGIGMAASIVDRRSGDVRQRTRRLGLRLHRQQHAAHVGVLQNRRRWHRFVESGRPALHAVPRVIPRALIGALGNADAFDADRESRQVHHDEHILEAAILLPHQIADRAAVVAIRQHGGRTGVNAELVLDGHAVNVVARAEASVIVDHELRHQE